MRWLLLVALTSCGPTEFERSCHAMGGHVEIKAPCKQVCSNNLPPLGRSCVEHCTPYCVENTP